LKTNKDLLIVGAYPAKNKDQHPGGVITATTQLVSYLRANNILHDIVDTSQNSFPRPSKLVKFFHAFKRLKNILYFLSKNNYKGSIIFSTDGLGFFEKIIFALIIEFKKVPTIFFQRSGRFFYQINNSIIFKKTAIYLLSKVTYIAHQGGLWNDFYKKLNVKQNKLYQILNWIKIKKTPKKLIRNANNEGLVFLYAGWLIEEKGVQDLIDVIIKNVEFDKHTFVFAGSGTLFKSIDKLVKNKNIKNIILKGWLSEARLVNEYKKADVFLFPSHLEGFPNVILEALNYRLPIIATNVGGVSETIINDFNGYLIEPRNKSQLLKAITLISSDYKKRRKFSNNSFGVLLKNHKIEINCKKLLDIFKI
jgi:glycosyltransferase involved in cell wall biosynthesis